MNILVTGGAGYIATHTIVELSEQNHRCIVIDNLVNSSKKSLSRVKKITGKSIPFYEMDMCDAQKLSEVFDNESIDAVVHFAGLKSVTESIERPLLYYKNNLNSTIVLLETMQKHSIKKLIFSSSATVYGKPKSIPITENHPKGKGITNPYGHTKNIIEQILHDYAITNPSFECTILRYFNPVGAHKSGLIGESPNGTPNNLLPYVAQVAAGKRPEVTVFGNDYETHDGTGVRDYIHVLDLASGHSAALDHLQPGCAVYNLCTGVGTSVLELIAAFEKASGKNIPYSFAERRPGDIASCYASAEKAHRMLGWRATRSIEEACEDSWRWQLCNPDGF